MNDPVASREIWNALVAVEHYFHYGIAEQLESAVSFGGEDALPVHEAYRTFGKLRPFLSEELIEAVEVTFQVIEREFNQFINALREVTLFPVTDVVRRREAEKAANLVLNQTLLAYCTQLKVVEQAVRQSSASTAKAGVRQSENASPDPMDSKFQIVIQRAEGLVIGDGASAAQTFENNG